MGFKFTHLEIPEIILIECDPFTDKRGFFSEVYRQEEFLRHGIGPFVQENYSQSIRGVVRGLHYQSKPNEVGKLVSCPHGTIFDVVVDIRHYSRTFGKWTGAVLENGNAMLWVPPGFAHGFCVLSNTANVSYRQTQYYQRDSDRCIRWNDPSVGIKWPITDPILSDKDARAPLLDDVEDKDLL